MVSEAGQSGTGHTIWWRTPLLILLISAATFGVFLVFEHYLRVAATILLLAVVTTYLLQPLVEWIVKVMHKANAHTVRVTAVLVIYLLIALIIFGMGASIGHTLVQQVQAFRATFTQGIMPEQLQQLQRWYEITVPADLRQQLWDQLQQEINNSDYSQRMVAWALGIGQKFIGWIGLLIELIFVPLIAFYFLTEATEVREQVIFFVAPRHRETVLKYAAGIGRIFGKYVQGQLVLCLIAWIAVTIAMLALRVPGALLLGVIAGASRAIPMLGPLVGGIPVVGAVWLHPASAGFFWWVLIGFTALHLFESKFLMPRILGDHLGIHPIIIIISLLVGYAFLGLLGMFIAPPAVAIVRFILAVRRAEREAESAQPPLPGLAEAEVAARV